VEDLTGSGKSLVEGSFCAAGSVDANGCRGSIVRSRDGVASTIPTNTRNSPSSEGENDDDPMNELLGSSITYRIAVGPQAGRKVFTLQTLPAGDPDDSGGDAVGKVAEFSLHAGVATKAHQRKKLERLCRYITRPAVSEKRMSLRSGGNIRYQLKTPYRNGTTHVIF